MRIDEYAMGMTRRFDKFCWFGKIMFLCETYLKEQHVDVIFTWDLLKVRPSTSTLNISSIGFGNTFFHELYKTSRGNMAVVAGRLTSKTG